MIPISADYLSYPSFLLSYWFRCLWQHDQSFVSGQPFIARRIQDSIPVSLPSPLSYGSIHLLIMLKNRWNDLCSLTSKQDYVSLTLEADNALLCIIHRHEFWLVHSFMYKIWFIRLLRMSPVRSHWNTITYHISHQRGILPSSMASPPADHASTEWNVWPPCLLHHVLPFDTNKTSESPSYTLDEETTRHLCHSIKWRSKSVNYPALLLSRRSTSSS